MHTTCIPILKHPASLLILLLFLTTTRAAPPTTSPAAPFTTTLLTPDGHPAAGARAVLAPTGHFISVTDGLSFDDDPAYSRATADATGQLRITPTTRPSLLAIIHPAGAAYVTDDALAHLPATLRLTPWSRLEGRRMIGPNPAPDRAVVAWADRAESDPYDPRIPSVRYLSDARTDSAGHYLLDHLPPGSVFLAPDDPMTWGPSINRPLIHLNLPPGQTVTANLGGAGRVVEGRLTLSPDLPATSPADRLFYLCMLTPNLPPVPSPLPADLQHQPSSVQSAWLDRFNTTPAGQAYHAAERARIATIQSHTYPFDVRPDGTYHVDDVPPGDYELSLELRTPPAPGQKPTRKVGQCTLTFTLPPSAGRTPFTAPPAEVLPAPLLNVGDPAPDFTVPGLDDHPLTLSSFRGQYVLLQFWATWCGPCVAEMPQVKSAHDAFAADPHFVTISLSFDPTPDLPTRYAATHHLAWRHGFLGDLGSSPVAARWGITAIPSLWLIAPDGRILRKNLRPDDLPAELAKALRKVSP